MAEPSFRRGGDESREAAAAASGAQFAKTHFLTIPEDDQVVLRYVIDKNDWIYVDQHGSIPTKNKPAGYEGNWPDSMPAVCRHDDAFQGLYSDCYICDSDEMKEKKNQWGRPVNKASIRDWAIACLREEVIGTKEMAEAGDITEAQVGKRLGFRDAKREVAIVGEDGKPTGETREELALVVVNFAPGNYFNGISAQADVYGTACDRDYVVKRTGTGKDTEYTHVGYDFTPNLHPAFERDGVPYEETESWGRYAAAMKEQNLDLGEVVGSRASDEYFARFFDPSKSAPGSGSSSSASRPEVAQSTPEVDEDRLAAMRARVRGGSRPTADVD